MGKPKELPVVGRECLSCGYKRFAREAPKATRQSPSHLFRSWPWILWPFAIVLWPLSIVWSMLSIFTMRRRSRQYFAGLAYEQFARCPRCGSEQVRTVAPEGFVPSAAAALTAVVNCPSCGKPNRVTGDGKRRCGSCAKEFTVTRQQRNPA